MMASIRQIVLTFGLGAVLAAAGAAQAAPAATGAAAGEPAAEASDEPEQPSGGKGRSYKITYRLDTRGMGTRGEKSRVDIMAAEAEVTGEAGEHFEYAVQIPLVTAMKGRGRDMHFGNLYVVYRRKLGEPTVKVGQFVLPFGNLPYYETHTRPVQTLYRYSLGTRIEPGVEVEGFLSKETEFQLSLTTGNGPWRWDNNGDKVVSARVSRTFELGDNELRLGVSGLRGTLPVYSLMSDPVMGKATPLGSARKTRVAVDAEYYWGPYLLRAEVVGGTDNGKGAYGHWLQASYPLSYETSLEAGTERWSQASGGLTGYWLGAEHKLDERQTARVALQWNRSREMGMTMSMPMITAQYLVEF